MGTPREIVDQFRVEIDDAAEPYLWSDDEFAEYLDDAQKRFCRFGVGVADVLEVALVEGTEWYAKPPQIVKIRGAAYTTPAWRHTDIHIVEYESFQRAGFRFDNRPGRTRQLVTGMKQDFFRAAPAPYMDADLELTVYRMPLVSITGDNLDSVQFEIQDHYTQGLKLWMFARAYRKHDADTFDQKKAAGYEQEFAAYCFSSARQQEKADRVVGVVEYGGL